MGFLHRASRYLYLFVNILCSHLLLLHGIPEEEPARDCSHTTEAKMLPHDRGL